MSRNLAAQIAQSSQPHWAQLCCVDFPGFVICSVCHDGSVNLPLVYIVLSFCKGMVIANNVPARNANFGPVCSCFKKLGEMQRGYDTGRSGCVLAGQSEPPPRHDDPVLIPEQVRQAFSASRYREEVASTGAEGIKRVGARTPDVILLDLRRDAAIEAMKQGAYDYLFKPLDLHQLRKVVGDALEEAGRMREPTVLAETSPDPDVDGAIVGSCPAMHEVYKAIGRVAAQNVPVLITGESGTGKELVARAIYQHGPRAKAPFLAINCAAIPIGQRLSRRRLRSSFPSAATCGLPKTGDMISLLE